MSVQFPQRNTVLVTQDVEKELPAGVRNRYNSRYAYFETVSQGERSVVQTCKDLHLGRTVCYKSLAPALSADLVQQRHFLREARITALLEHPHTVPVYEINRDARGHYYFTMPQIGGTTYDEMLDALQSNTQDTSLWDLEGMIDILIRVCNAIHFAHHHGVIHCNLTPQHILAGAFGEVHVLDWSLAKLKDSPSELVQAKEVDPLYMSPEQSAGEEIDHRSDIYSLGAIMFELLTLESQSWGATLKDMFAQGLLAPRETPSAIETICLQCVAKDPEHRFQSMGDLIQALHQWRRLRADNVQLAGSV